MHTKPSRIHLVLLVLLAVLLALILIVSETSSTTPALSAVTVATPKHLVPGTEATLVDQITNLGDSAAVGSVSPIVVVDTLPEGLEAVAISGEGCVLATLRCEMATTIIPFERVEVQITVRVSNTAGGTLFNTVSVGGGGAAGSLTREAVTVSNEPVTGGLEKAQLVTTNEDGSQDTLAGSHPFQLTSTIVTNSLHTKDIHVDLPAGLVGNTNVVAQCTTPQFDEILESHLNGCPPDTAIGVATAYLGAAPFPLIVPLFNLVPAPGEPARFGFAPFSIPIIIDTAVRTGRDYGVAASINNIQQLKGVNEAQVTFWGVPADPVHNQDRGWNCLFDALGQFVEPQPCVSPESPALVPFLTLPTSCSGPGGLTSSAVADSWLEPGVFSAPVEFTPALGLQGCGRLGFEPEIKVAPDGSAASTPSGLGVDVHEAQEGALNPTGVSAADEKNVTVSLPGGVSVNPAGADGLETCSNAQIGFEKANAQGLDEFTSGRPSCPDASKIATVRAKTPLLPNALEGAVYLASPQNFAGPLENPFGSLVAMYIVAEDPVSGVLVKAPGKVVLDPVTGQLTATFENVPQVPVEDVEVHFFGSARAPLSTPPLCGSYQTTASITPWSGTPAVTPSSTFAITTGPDGQPCRDPQPFNPEFNAETTNIQAGAFTPFTLTMTRPDADQTLSRIEMSMPPGLLGSLSSVKLCGEPQASTGECGPESLIGETIVSAGLGGDPYTVTGGKVYITTAYGGAPYGLSIVNPAKAGPFVLQKGRPVIVRAAIFVDPRTTALRILSDKLPTIIEGIPLQIQHVNVNINRPGFTFNPTNCSKLQINATLTSTQETTAALSTPFQITNCATLSFNPKLTVTTNGKTSKANGASLTAKLTRALANEANVKEVKVDLPIQLPSRLSTLQKACTAAQFEANPAGCPAASIVGHARAITPLIPVPVEGPAYFVSHGGEAFPSLIVVLQGYGITVQLTATTAIKKGITSSTFKTAPDVPFSTFELNLPQGKYSALAAFGSLCKTKLTMPTHYTAQNGAEINTTTPIKPTNCPTTHTKRRKKRKG